MFNNNGEKKDRGTPRKFVGNVGTPKKMKMSM